MQNLTEYIQVLKAPDDLDWRRTEEAIMSEQESFQPFMAFRSPVNSSNPIIKVFVQVGLSPAV